MAAFAGRWFTTFGPMELRQTKKKIQGAYWFQGIPCQIEGRLDGEKFVFRYQDPSGTGEGWFELARFGQFRGQFRLDGTETWLGWEGQREWDGIWETSFGRMRLIQEADRIHGFYDGAGPARIEGRIQGKRLVFRYFEPQVRGEGWFQLDEDAQSFTGAWHPDGATGWGDWIGRRVQPNPGLTWLMVIEAQWQTSIADRDYSYGNMLKEIFARLPHVAVRQRFFNDEASLQRWCRELIYCPEPAIVLIASHGTPEGVTVHGQTINTKLVIDSLRPAGNVRLLHFSACLVMQEDNAGDFLRRIDSDVPFPISGYTTSVDWGGSAIVEFSYLDMMLAKNLPPETAARLLPRMVAYAGDDAPPESPYIPVGFRFHPAGR